MRSSSKRVPILLLIILVLLALLCVVLSVRSWPGVFSNFQVLTGRSTATPKAMREAELSIQNAVAKQADLPIFLMYDTQIDFLNVSPDNDWATAVLVPRDPDSGEIIPAEPGLAIAVRDENGEWKTVLPSDPEWLDALIASPPDLIPPEEKEIWLKIAASEQALLPTGPLGGYFLPWTFGDTMRLTQSVGHDRYTSNKSAHYSFDFATPGASQMYDIKASKGGFVHKAVWHHPNGSEGNSKSNYIILEDRTTTPWTYQLYLHLAQDSIPEELRVVGTPVVHGQFIGVADDTGVSSNHHLHFHVHAEPNYWWAQSLDITFNEVEINGGRPRITSDLSYCSPSDVCDETQRDYVSKNLMNPDHIPPSGDIEKPEHGITAHSDKLFLKGWAADENSGILSAQFIANYNGSWHNVGSPFSTNFFSMDWDMCADKVPDGPVSLALEITDKAFNKAPGLPGLRHITKNYACTEPQPTCVPTGDQIALFADPGYEGGCVVLNAGSYTSLGSLGSNNAESIQVGVNVQATLFKGSNLRNRGDTFFADDSNLSDNRIGANSASSVLVESVNKSPTPPSLLWPMDSANFTSADSLSLSWDNTGGATQYQALLQSSSESIALDWQSAAAWHLSSLSPGNYSWKVKARNSASESGWSSVRTFIVLPPPGEPTIQPITPPFTDTMETSADNWSHNGTWERTNEENHTTDGAFSWKYAVGSGAGYDNGTPNMGYLTSQAISITEGGEQFLRFWYFYETEGPGAHWDQRWLQISVDNGPYTNLLQLSDDVPNFWLRSPAISLAAYAGQTIRVRFYFATLDQTLNTFRGWYIDDLSVTPEAPPDCGDDNNDPSRATDITTGTTLDAVICPGGDADYYKFTAKAGDRIGASVAAQTIGSKLDSILFLFDSDGTSILAENDDIEPAVLTDSFLTYRLKRDGTYFLKVRAWNNPTSGGPEYNYSLRFYTDNQDPIAIFLYPQGGGSIPEGPFLLTVLAADAPSGVSHVEFFWHPANWETGSWEKLGEDWDGDANWSYLVDPNDITPEAGMAFYANVYDWVGNWIGTGAWNINPVTIYFPLITKKP